MSNLVKRSKSHKQVKESLMPIIIKLIKKNDVLIFFAASILATLIMISPLGKDILEMSAKQRRIPLRITVSK